MNKKITVFQAPTGSGKTEMIAQEVVKHIKSGKPLIVALQSKESIERLLDRVKFYIKSEEQIKGLIEAGIIYKLISETSTEAHEKIDNATIILTHHNYFANVGDVLVYYSKLDLLMRKREAMLIVDEAHTFLSMVTRLDLEVGAVYRREVIDDEVSYYANMAGLTKFELEYSLETGELIQITNSLSKRFKMMNDNFGTWNIWVNNVIKEGAKYTDIVSYIKEHKENIDTVEDGFMVYESYKNNDIKPMFSNLEDTGTNIYKKLLDSADSYLLGYNTGDDIPRPNAGKVYLALFHSQLIKKVFNAFSKILLVTATISNEQIDLLNSLGEWEHIKKEQPIEKIGTIVVLRAINKDRNLKTMVMDELQKRPDINALIFTTTIEKAEEYADKYVNAWVNKNGKYIHKRKLANDYGYNIKRNVTLVGLESGVAKGYNYVEEIDELSSGIEFILIEKPPISPTILKKQIINNEIRDYQEDYNINTFTQAIGRPLRKDKKILVIGLGYMEDRHYVSIDNYLRTNTNSKIVNYELNATNINISLFKEEKETNKQYVDAIKQTQLWKEINNVTV